MTHYRLDKKENRLNRLQESTYSGCGPQVQVDVEKVPTDEKR